MTIDKQKLRALAEAATQSHGARRVEVDPNGVHVIGDGSWKILSAWHTPDGKGSQNAEFAAAASPATVLALLAEIDRLTTSRSKKERELEQELEVWRHGPSCWSCGDAGDVHDITGEWRGECDCLTARLINANRERDQLKAENEALRKDAGNWKAVLRAMEQLKSDEQGAAIWSACSRILISLASDLNSARSVVTEEGVTKDGAEIGDWRVTVERLAMAKEASHG